MSRHKLEIVEGPNAGQQLAVPGPLVIGRDPGADITIADEQASRRHARLTPQGDTIVVEDLGSTNGTYVNDNELVGPSRLDPGDTLLVGVTLFQLRTEEEIRITPSAVRQRPPALAAVERPPTYTADAKFERQEPNSGVPELDRLVDLRTKRKAKQAPLALFSIAALAVIVFLGAT